MMRLDEIEATIKELENEKVTYDTCQKLAVLYTVRDHNKNTQAVSSTLPSYNCYCTDKRKYQLGQVGKESVLTDLELLCSELILLIQTIYRGTDTAEERQRLRDTVVKISGICV